MERLISELVAQCMHDPSLGGLAIWVSFVTIVIWSPYLLPQRLSGLATHLFSYGMIGILAERTMHLSASPLPLLELTALGLTAIIVWVEAIKRKHEKDERKPSWQKEQFRDWSIAARLALWATLTFMPMVKWV